MLDLTSDGGEAASDAREQPMQTCDLQQSTIALNATTVTNPSPDNLLSDNLDAQTPSNNKENEDPSSSSLPNKKLDVEVLQVMGKRLTIDKIRPSPLHDDIVVRWKEIYKEGLPKEEKLDLFKKYVLSDNCIFLEPPKLNLEVKASLQDPAITRDTRLTNKQEKVSVCLAALGSLLSILVEQQEINPLHFIENISDCCRLLVDLQRDESLIRKSLMLSNLNASMKETLKETDIDEWLFGKQLDEKLKSAQLLEKSSKVLKPSSKNTSKPLTKNFKRPLRQFHKSYEPQRTKSASGQTTRQRQQRYAPNHRRTQNLQKHTKRQ